MMGAKVSFESINPDTDRLEKSTVEAKSLLTGDGLRFMFSQVVPNFMAFQAVGVIIVAMLGVGAFADDKYDGVRAQIHAGTDDVRFVNLGTRGNRVEIVSKATWSVNMTAANWERRLFEVLDKRL